MVENSTEPIKLSDVTLGDGLWKDITKTVCEKMLPYQWQVLNDEAHDAEPSHCVMNFKIAAKKEKGDFEGMVFQDSDLAKWIEAAAYSLSVFPNAKIEQWIDEAIEYIAAAQQQDGYLDTYFIIKAPDKRWTDLRDCHELYCIGHMMEAAVAYYEVTGKRKLLDVMLKVADHIHSVIGPEEGKIKGYPGHPEIELALVRMYHVTHEDKLLQLAAYFINERGQDPKFFIEEAKKRNTESHFPANTSLGLSYFQSHLPVRSQLTMEGHSVRALYLLSGMIDVAVNTNDQELLKTCYQLFDNVTLKRMYVTGGVGSTHVGEAFTVDYDLPNDTVYAETCASIALIFAAKRLLNIKPDGKIADVLETALYNTCLAGMALDAKHFFYVNPLEVIPSFCKGNPDKQHVLPIRPAWYGCACCPPNLARLICSLSTYIYSYGHDTLQINTFVSSKVSFEQSGETRSVSVDTDYPFNGVVKIKADQGKYGLNVHIPEWCHSYSVTVNQKKIVPEVRNGFIFLSEEWKNGDEILLNMEINPRRLYAHPKVAADAGCVAVARGPIVYCMEEADNGKDLHLISLPRQSKLKETEIDSKQFGRVIAISAEALTEQNYHDAVSLYTETPAVDPQSCEIKLVPYYMWANRGENEMRVWIRE